MKLIISILIITFIFIFWCMLRISSIEDRRLENIKKHTNNNKYCKDVKDNVKSVN